MRRTQTVLIALFAALALILAACGDDDDTAAEDTAAPETSEETTEESMADGAEMVTVDVYFVDDEAFASGTEPYVVAETREVSGDDPIASALAALYEGPTTDGLSLVASESTGATVSVADGVATVSLEGACSSGGSTMTIANQIIPTMKQFDEVDVVVILDPDGQTIDPSGATDSTPECLEP